MWILMNKINKQNRNRLTAFRGVEVRGLGEKGEKGEGIKQKTHTKLRQQYGHCKRGIGVGGGRRWLRGHKE